MYPYCQIPHALVCILVTTLCLGVYPCYQQPVPWCVSLERGVSTPRGIALLCQVSTRVTDASTQRCQLQDYRCGGLTGGRGLAAGKYGEDGL